MYLQMQNKQVDRIKEKLMQGPSQEFLDDRPQFHDNNPYAGQHMDQSGPYFDRPMEQIPLDFGRERFEQPYERPSIGTDPPFGSEVPFDSSLIIDPKTLDEDLRTKLKDVSLQFCCY